MMKLLGMRLGLGLAGTTTIDFRNVSSCRRMGKRSVDPVDIFYMLFCGLRLVRDAMQMAIRKSDAEASARIAGS
ncbi:MAG: hypothetical protein ONB51_18230 [candidate division KSB1 bacterium]|nr:hypothetical protein [candidate division KSB1 bacterium]MDZ7411163.1 hypothetical protein [candidate division KSB1 bacterium]